MPNLSDFNPEDIKPVSSTAPAENEASPLTLSSLSPDEVITHVPGGINEAKYGGLGQQAIGALETAGSAATFGLSKGLERAAGVNPEDIRGREEEQHPLVGLGAAAAGLVGSAAAMPSFGAAALLEKAGLKAATGLLGEAALNKMSGQAIKVGIENALFQGGNEVAKMMVSDPSQTVGTAAANIGLAGLFGAGAGAAISPLKGMWAQKFGTKLENNLENATSSIHGEGPKLPEEAIDLSGHKGNINQLREDANNLGITLTPGMESGEHFIQHVEGNLSRRPTFAGVSLAKEGDKVFEGLNKAGEELLQNKTVKTEVQVGKEIKQGLSDSLNKEYKALQARYNEFEPKYGSMEVPGNLRMDAADALTNSDYARADKELGSLAESLSKDISGADNVKQLRIKRSIVGDKLEEAMRAGSPKARIYQQAYELLSNLRSATIDQVTDNAALKALDTEYAAFKGKLNQLGVEGGLGKIDSTRKLLKSFDKISDESLPKRLFNADDVGQTQFFKDKFPKEYDLARRYKLSEIHENSISDAMGKNKEFQVGNMLRQVSDKKLGPEARALLFDNTGIGKLESIQRLYSAIPENPNPSGTSYAHAFGDMFSLHGLAQNAIDAVQYAFLKGGQHIMKAVESAGGDEAAKLAALKVAASPGKPVSAEGFKAMADYIRATIKGETAVSKATKSVFKAGEIVVPSKLKPEQKSREKLDERLKDLQANNSDLLKTGEDIGHYMPEQAAAMAQTSAQALNYLNSLRPNVDKKSPLDTKIKPDPIAQAKYDRALDIAEQPLLSIAGIKEGRIVPEDIVSLKNLYPGLYERLSSKLMNGIMEASTKEENIPYKTRLGLSMFLNQPLDSTMTPQSILAMQASNATVSPKQQQEGGSVKPTASGMTKLTKLPQSYLTPDQARSAQKLQA